MNTYFGSPHCLLTNQTGTIQLSDFVSRGRNKSNPFLRQQDSSRVNETQLSSKKNNNTQACENLLKAGRNDKKEKKRKKPRRPSERQSLFKVDLQPIAHGCPYGTAHKRKPGEASRA